MRLPIPPPRLEHLIGGITAERLRVILAEGVGPAPKGRYRHWDKVRYLTPPAGLTHEEWWLGIKLPRRAMYRELPLHAIDGAPIVLALVDPLIEYLHQVDRDAAGAIHGADSAVLDPNLRDSYLFASLAEEAITSSQLEGASTTRDVAKEMIRTGRTPKDHGERMILNGFRAMESVRDLRGEPLTPAVILELHRILTIGTLDPADGTGRLRRADEPIVVEDADGTRLHTPPPARELQKRLEALCDFANGAGTDGQFLHPVLRAIVLHFQLAYDHPFVDGNGRVARALFYWAMAEQGYWLAEYLSISRILRAAPSRYARSYLYTESDDNDVTYFALHQLEVLVRAISDLHAYLLRKAAERRDVARLLERRARWRDQLNPRQITLLHHAMERPGFVYTIESHRRSHRVSYPTARADLLELAKMRLLGQDKAGRAFVFIAPPNLRARLKGK